MKTSGKTKAEIVAEVRNLPDYMVVAGAIIKALKALDNNAHGPFRTIDDQRRKALRLAENHFRL